MRNRAPDAIRLKSRSKKSKNQNQRSKPRQEAPEIPQQLYLAFKRVLRHG